MFIQIHNKTENQNRPPPPDRKNNEEWKLHLEYDLTCNWKPETHVYTVNIAVSWVCMKLKILLVILSKKHME